MWKCQSAEGLLPLPNAEAEDVELDEAEEGEAEDDEVVEAELLWRLHDAPPLVPTEGLSTAAAAAPARPGGPFESGVAAAPVPDHLDLAVASQAEAEEEQAVQRAAAEPDAPPVAKAAGAVVRGPTRMADATITVEGGRISYYANKSTFEAVCGNHLHGRCVLSRTSRGRAGRGSRAAGRPLAFLLCWLNLHECPSKSDHWEKTTWAFSHAERLAARNQLMETPGGPALAAFERPTRPDEGEEPEGLDGLL